MMVQVRQMFRSFLHLIYPPICLYCQAGLTSAERIFCDVCTDLLHLIEPSERCRYCFGEVSGQPKWPTCTECRQKPAVLHGSAAAFDYVGPAACLVKCMKYGHQPTLATGAAAFMVAQFTRLDWPMPDKIIPVPMPFLRQLSRGYNQSQLLADEVGRLLQRPVVQALRRSHGDYSQAGLSLKQRRTLDRTTFQLGGQMDFVDECLLLIDDVTTSGTTLQRCGQALQEGYPSQIYSLAFCQA